jgi:hypothetical protein
MSTYHADMHAMFTRSTNAGGSAAHGVRTRLHQQEDALWARRAHGHLQGAAPLPVCRGQAVRIDGQGCSATWHMAVSENYCHSTFFPQLISLKPPCTAVSNWVPDARLCYTVQGGPGVLMGPLGRSPLAEKTPLLRRLYKAHGARENRLRESPREARARARVGGYTPHAKKQRRPNIWAGA